ncbi:MAG TPA: copper transporter [Thermoleophilaceae bacterium]|nr:copper transporter [Thermoleophilaceae bacterium]
MLDFRYHALSLVAVFLALAIGIVLGVTIGDSLVSDAERSLRGDLRADVENARGDAAKARAELAGRDRMLDQIYPTLVATRLAPERVALISWGSLPNNVEGGVRDAVSKGGGRLDSISVFDKPLTMLKQAIGKGVFSEETADEESLRALGRSLARAIIGVSGGSLMTSLEASAPDEFAGRFRGADAVAFFEAPSPSDGSDGDGVKERDDDRAKAIEAAMIDELTKQTINVVGVEATNTEPSQISRYKSLKLSSSDSVDVAGGKLALVFALAGAKGNYGLKSSADQSLPDEALTP